MSAVREKTKEELFDDLVAALSELEVLRAKWDAIPWEEIANGCKAATRHGMWVTADALIDWFAANAPEEAGE